jgi:purine-cytosine permease-like protein
VSTKQPGGSRSLEAGAAIAVGEGVDDFGRVETRGADEIPAEERRSKPFELFTVFFGLNFGFGGMLFGALPIAFGLGWWASFWAVTVGSVVGSLVFITMAFISPRTGTNGPVSSGAFFGVRGRLLGSSITWFVVIGFTIIVVWVAGESVTASFARWFGTPNDNNSLALAMIGVLVLTCLTAILGHRTIERSTRVISVLGLVMTVLLVAAFAPRFHQVPNGSFLLGSFWPTWFISVTTTASLPLSWGPLLGDYGRYIPADTSPRRIGIFAFSGIFFGCWFAMLAAAFAATSFRSQAGNFVGGITAAAPGWIVLPMLVVLGLVINIECCGMSVYNAALDIGAWPLFFRFRRWVIASGLSVLVFALTYLLVIVVNVLASIQAFVTIMVVTATPWMVIVGLGNLLNRGNYVTRDLHSFAIPGFRGRYWYWKGVNVRAVIAWACGVALGCMFSTTSLFTGPLESSVDGVDLSWLVAGVVGALVFLALRHVGRAAADAPALAETGVRG